MRQIEGRVKWKNEKETKKKREKQIKQGERKLNEERMEQNY